MTSLISVLAEIAKSVLPQEAQAFLAAVIEGETPQNEGLGYSPWNILYSGAGEYLWKPGLVNETDDSNILMVGKWRYWIPSLITFPTWHGGKTSHNFSTAAGAFQITGTTWRDNFAFGITGFQPQDQILFAWKLAQQRFSRHTSVALLEALHGTDYDRRLINAYLASTWPGGCNSGFVKRYAANLAALQAPPIPTPPPDETIVVDLPLLHGVGKETGKTYSLAWLPKVASIVIAGSLAGPTLRLPEPPIERMPYIATSPIPALGCVPEDLRRLIKGACAP